MAALFEVGAKEQRDWSGPSGGHGGCSGSYHPCVGFLGFGLGGLRPSNGHYAGFGIACRIVAPGVAERDGSSRSLRFNTDEGLFRSEVEAESNECMRVVSQFCSARPSLLLPLSAPSIRHGAVPFNAASQRTGAGRDVRLGSSRPSHSLLHVIE